MPLIGDPETFNKNISRITQMFGNIGMTKMEDRLSRQRMAEQMKGYMDLEKTRSENELGRIDYQSEAYKKQSQLDHENQMAYLEKQFDLNGAFGRKLRKRIEDTVAKGGDVQALKEEYDRHMDDVTDFLVKAGTGQDPDPKTYRAMIEEFDKGFDSIAYELVNQGGQKWMEANVSPKNRQTQVDVANINQQGKLIDLQGEMLRQNKGSADQKHKDELGLIGRAWSYVTGQGVEDPNNPGKYFESTGGKNRYAPEIQGQILEDLAAIHAKIVRGESMSDRDINYIQRVFRQDEIEKFGIPDNEYGVFPEELNDTVIPPMVEYLMKNYGLTKEQAVTQAILYKNAMTKNSMRLRPGQAAEPGGPVLGYSERYPGVVNPVPATISKK